MYNVHDEIKYTKYRGFLKKNYRMQLLGHIIVKTKHFLLLNLDKRPKKSKRAKKKIIRKSSSSEVTSSTSESDTSSVTSSDDSSPRPKKRCVI